MARTVPAEASSPDADRAGPCAHLDLRELLVRLLASIILFLLERRLAAKRHRDLTCFWQERTDLPIGSAQQEAAVQRGTFGTGIAWMCLRRGIGPTHPDWPYVSRTIVAFGGSIAAFRPGLRAAGLQWWENPRVFPGMIGETPAVPAAHALAMPQAQPVTPHAAAAKPAAALPHTVPFARRPASIRGATDPRIGPQTGPSTGPPAPRATLPAMPDARGRTTASPAVLIRAARNDRRKPDLRDAT